MGASWNDPKAFVWVEDRHAVGFISGLLLRLNKPLPTIKSAKGREKMLTKMRRIALDVLEAHGYDKMVVLIDGHGDPQAIALRCHNAISPELRGRVKAIIFEESIEEWVCVGLSLSLKGRKPLDVLLAYERGKKGPQIKEKDVKRWLPSYAERINVNKLRQNRLFGEFLKAISDCPWSVILIGKGWQVRISLHDK